MLLEFTPEGVQPGCPADYFSEEQVELWESIPSSASGTIREPTTAGPPCRWEAGGSFRVCGAAGADYTPRRRDGRAVRRRLHEGERPTALAISVLDVKQPADWEGDPAATEHWCLAHYLLDGHHKPLAAARTPTAPAALVLWHDEGVSREHDVDLIREALGRSAE